MHINAGGVKDNQIRLGFDDPNPGSAADVFDEERVQKELDRLRTF